MSAARWLFAAGAMAVALAAGLWELGSRLSAPVPRPAGEPPADLPAVDVAFPGGSDSLLHGWYVPGARPGRGVVLLHGVRSSRRSLVGRARFLHRAGYDVLLFDLRAHGESPGEAITFGALEAGDAAAAVAWMQARRPGEAVAAIGVSLGAAAAVLGVPSGALTALVVESMHPTLEEAVANRLALRLGAPARVFVPLLLAQLRWRLGVEPGSLAPIGRIARLGAPLLVATGSEDRRTPLAQARRVFDAAREPKTLWVVEGARHQDLHRFAPAAYEARIGAFLDAAFDASAQKSSGSAR